jgi:putative ABC transport system permease protein
MDGTVLLLTVLLSSLTAVVLTLAPVWNSLKLTLAESVRTGGNKTQTQHEHRVYKLLVVGQFACAVVLLAGAGLLIESFILRSKVDYGYDPRELMTMNFPQPQQNRQAFVDEVLQRIQSAPGVEFAAVMSFERFGQLNFPFNLQNNPFPNGDVLVRYSSVTPEYFRVLNTPLLAGRTFDSRDTINAPGVAIVNEKLARGYFPGGNPIGRKIVLSYNNQRLVREVVGIARNIRQDGPEEPIKPEILVPWSQLPWLSGTLLIRANGEPAGVQKAVQDVIWSMDRNLPASNAKTLDEILNSQLATPRLYMILLGAFSAVALSLAGIGIYGLLSYLVSRRRQEMAVRVAIGAKTPDLIRMVLGEGIRLSIAGALLGLVLSFALVGFMQSMLFEVSATDPVAFAIATFLLLTAALAACYIPARRASRADPIEALRHE